MLQSRLVRYIDAVARHGSIRKASESLNIAPSAINRQILDFEHQLGMPLFDRMPRGMRLTSAGEVVVDHIRRMDGELSVMTTRLKSIRGLQAGTVKVVAASGLMSSFVATTAARFSQDHPLAELKIDTLPLEDIVAVVSNGDADLGLSFDIPRDPSLRTLASMHQPLGVIAAPGHALSSRPALRLGDLVGEPLILPPVGAGIRILLDVAFSEARIEPRIVVESNSVELRKHLVAAGAGITILAAVDVLGDVAKGVLSHVPLADPFVPGQTLKLVSRARGTLEPLQAKLAEAFRRDFAELGADV